MSEMPLPTTYLSGPMSNQPYFNIPAFDAAAAALRSRGYVVISPAELDSPEFRELCKRCLTGSIDELRGRCHARFIEPETWGSLLARDVKLLADDGIESIACLPGWQTSRGARLETFAGRMLGLRILEYPSMRPVSYEALEKAHGAIRDGESGDKGEQVSWKGKKPMNLATITTENGESQTGRVWKERDSHGTALRELDIEGYQEEYGWQKETRVVDPETGGEKDSKQAVLGDLDPRALMEVAKVAGFGRTKYSRLNYAKGYAWSLSYDACQRHLHAFWNREELDEETGLHHLAAAAWHCLTLLSFVLRSGLSIPTRGTDDRMV